MFTLRHAAVRAAAIASRRAPLTSTTTISRQFSIAAPRAFARTWVVRNTEKPLEPLEETTKPGVESGVTLESEEKLAQALENPATEATEAEAKPAAEALEALEQPSGLEDIEAIAEAEQDAVARAEKKAHAAHIVEERQRSLFVQNLSWDVTEEVIREDFSTFGEIESIFRAGGRATWCIIVFSKPEEMKEASKQVDGTFWHGRRITAIPRRISESFVPKRDRSDQPARRERPKMAPTPYLYVGNIPYDVTDAELTNLFDSVENATGVRIATDPATGMPRGYAHIDFRSIADAEAALKVLQGTQIRGRNIVSNFADKREPRGRAQRPANRDRSDDWSSRD